MTAITTSTTARCGNWVRSLTIRFIPAQRGHRAHHEQLVAGQGRDDRIGEHADASASQVGMSTRSTRRR